MSRKLGYVLIFALGSAVAAASCDARPSITTSGTGSASGGAGGESDTASTTKSSGTFSGSGSETSGTGVGGAEQVLSVEPAAMQTITVPLNQQTPTLAYTATLNGNPVNAGWGVDRGDIGKVTAGPASSTTFTPTGKTGGLVKVIAGLNNETVERTILVKLTGTQNGGDPTNPAEAPQFATTIASLTAGGGIGGVGGEGLGLGVTDPTTQTALATPGSDGSAEGLKLVYPYDKTVWPRGMLAPLLMWSWAQGDADAIQIELETTSGSFSWKGTFTRPAILAQTGKPFVRHPIPQDIWAAATNSAGGADQLTVRLTIARNGQGYGPIVQTQTIAPARLSGIIYYNSYGTQLAKNYPGAVGGDGMFGGAVLSIHGGDTGPVLAAGGNGNATKCRVCHSVAGNGSRLIAQHGENSAISSGYDLTPMSTTEFPLAISAEFPAMYPDGSMALSKTTQLLPLPDDSTPLPATGLTSTSTNLGTPAFSPDGKHVVFNPMAGPLTNPTQKLVVMDFDPATFTFSNPFVVVDDTGQPAERRSGWGAFAPDGKSVIFNHQIAAGVDGNGLGDMRTRKGARAEIAIASTTAAGATRLNQLNGLDAADVSYLPKLAAPVNLACTGDAVSVGAIDADHGNDVTLNYEPTVNPIASGGYVWVVFTSRRLYGSVAAIPPFCSDPRGVDLVQNITTKKLWVSAIDLSAPPGTDGSHPSFYLPAQELLAGNSRGFWALDPCKADGNGCESGDQCCNGFCQPDPTSQELVCSNMPPNGMCSAPQEKCTTAADCCDMTNLCVNGFCAQSGPG